MTNTIQSQAVAVEQSGTRIFTPNAVAWASVFGSPVAGSIVMAMNYSRWGKKGAAWKAVGLGVVGTVALGMLSVYLGAGAEFGLPIAIGGVIVTRQLAEVFQGKKVAAHLAAGGKQASNWKGVGIGVLMMLLSMGMLAGWYVSEGGRWPNLFDTQPQVSVGPDETVYYSHGATKEMAQALGAKLHEIGFLNNEAATIYLSGTGKEKELSFVVQDEAWSRPEAVQTLKQVTELVADSIGGKPVTVRMLDTKTHEKNRIVVN